MTPDDLDARLRAMPAPDPAATARLRRRIAEQIARSPLPAPLPWWRGLVPAGCGALAMALCCAIWLALPTAPAGNFLTGDFLTGDFLTGIATLPFTEEVL